jgi:hypothetical protein
VEEALLVGAGLWWRKVKIKKNTANEVDGTKKVRERHILRKSIMHGRIFKNPAHMWKT